MLQDAGYFDRWTAEGLNEFAICFAAAFKHVVSALPDCNNFGRSPKKSDTSERSIRVWRCSNLSFREFAKIFGGSLANSNSSFFSGVCEHIFLGVSIDLPHVLQLYSKARHDRPLHLQVLLNYGHHRYSKACPSGDKGLTRSCKNLLGSLGSSTRLLACFLNFLDGWWP